MNSIDPLLLLSKSYSVTYVGQLVVPYAATSLEH